MLSLKKGKKMYCVSFSFLIGRKQGKIHTYASKKKKKRFRPEEAFPKLFLFKEVQIIKKTTSKGTVQSQYLPRSQVIFQVNFWVPRRWRYIRQLNYSFIGAWHTNQPERTDRKLAISGCSRHTKSVPPTENTES